MNPLCNDCRYYEKILPGYCRYFVHKKVRITRPRGPGDFCGPEAIHFIERQPIPKPGLGYVEAGHD